MRRWSSKKGEGQGLKFLLAHVGHQSDGCLIWPLFRDPGTGRGRVSFNGRPSWAHRVMCELVHGPAPTPAHQAAHECGKGHEGCVNPRHLSWKTISENLLDRRQHGTARSHNNGKNGKLKPEQIAQIIALKGKMPKRDIAAKFGVGYGAIQYWHGIRERRLSKRTA